MRESVVYQRILREGRHEGVRTSILQALEVRFGSVPQEVAQRLEALTSEQLQELHRQAVICETLEEFISQMESVG